MNLPSIIIAGIAFFFLAWASYVDLRTGEIAEKINRGLVASMVVISAALSLFFEDPGFVVYTLLLGVSFFLMGYLMFCLGEWGGGDVKLLAGVGCALGLLNELGHFSGNGAFPYYLDYFINFALAAGPYVILYCLILGLVKPQVFSDFSGTLKKRTTILVLITSFIPPLAAMSFAMGKLTLIYLTIPLMVLASFYLKSVEKTALQKTISIDELKEEDILAEDLVVDGRKIAGKRDAEGLSRKQLDEILKLASEKKIPEKITIKWGVRFAPVFFLAFLLTFFFGNVLEIIIMSLLS